MRMDPETFMPQGPCHLPLKPYAQTHREASNRPGKRLRRALREGIWPSTSPFWPFSPLFSRQTAPGKGSKCSGAKFFTSSPRRTLQRSSSTSQPVMTPTYAMICLYKAVHKYYAHIYIYMYHCIKSYHIVLYYFILYHIIYTIHIVSTP